MYDLPTRGQNTSMCWKLSSLYRQYEIGEPCLLSLNSKPIKCLNTMAICFRYNKSWQWGTAVGLWMGMRGSTWQFTWVVRHRVTSHVTSMLRWGCQAVWTWIVTMVVMVTPSSMLSYTRDIRWSIDTRWQCRRRWLLWRGQLRSERVKAVAHGSQTHPFRTWWMRSIPMPLVYFSFLIFWGAIFTSSELVSILLFKLPGLWYRTSV